MGEVIIRSYKSHDAEGINAMLTKYLPYKRDDKFWVWINRIIGGKSIAFVAEYEGKIVGHYAIVPRDMFVNGLQVKAALSIHAFVDPDYRNKLFIFQITQKLYHYAKQQGIQLIYGFPNANYRTIQLKIEKWKQVDLFKSFEYDLKDSQIIKAEDVDSVLIQDVDFTSLYDISQIEENTSVISLLSDARYWMERYMLHPQKLYNIYALKKKDSILGYFVTKIYENNEVKYYHLIDYKLTHEAHYSDLLDAYEKLGRMKNIDVLSVWQGDEVFKKAIEERGFLQKGFETFLGIKVLDDSIIEVEEILNINNWRLVMGDSDAF